MSTEESPHCEHCAAPLTGQAAGGLCANCAHKMALDPPAVLTVMTDDTNAAYADFMTVRQLRDDERVDEIANGTAAIQETAGSRSGRYKPQRAAFLRRYDLDALARDTGRMNNEYLAALWVRAANHLLELLPDTKIGVGPKVTTARGEAARAARKALEPVPGLPAAEEVLKKF